MVDHYKISQKSQVLLAELKRSNMRFVHWKGTSHLIESLNGKTDIELLIHQNDREIFNHLIPLLDFKKVKSQPFNIYPNIEDWIGFDEERGSLIHLHTHFSLVLTLSHGRYINLPWTEKYFNFLTTDVQTGWPIPLPELEALILIVRIWLIVNYKRGSNVKEDLLAKQIELIGLLKQSELTKFQVISKELQVKLPTNFDNFINKIIYQGNFDDIDEIGKIIVGQLSLDKKNLLSPSPIYIKFYSGLKNKLYSYIGPLTLKKTITNGGKIIAFVGSDGSGKSTLSEDIIKWLTFKIDAHYMYLGKNPFTKSYNKNIYTNVNLIYKNSFITQVIKKLFKKFYYVSLIYNKVLMLKSARKLSQNGSIIICDRFPQTNILGFNDGPKLSHLQGSVYSKIEMKLFEKLKHQKADLVLRLNVSPEVASLRKPEHDPELIKLKCESINKIDFHDSAVVEIDANKPYEEVFLTTKREIWKLL